MTRSTWHMCKSPQITFPAYGACCFRKEDEATMLIAHAMKYTTDLLTCNMHQSLAFERMVGINQEYAHTPWLVDARPMNANWRSDHIRATNLGCHVSAIQRDNHARVHVECRSRNVDVLRLMKMDWANLRPCTINKYLAYRRSQRQLPIRDLDRHP